MFQYLLVAVSLAGHYGSTYLAEAHAMAPSGSAKDETTGNPALYLFFLYHKGGAVEVGGA